MSRKTVKHADYMVDQCYLLQRMRDFEAQIETLRLLFAQYLLDRVRELDIGLGQCEPRPATPKTPRTTTGADCEVIPFDYLIFRREQRKR
jgi:hypothetical protein